MAHFTDSYPPIADYGLISDCHCAALVSKTGSVDWCCMPRFDADSCFGRLLDWEKGGYCSIRPALGPYQTMRRYVPDTMVLETCFRTGSGEARLYDFFVMNGEAGGSPRYELARLIEGCAGYVEFAAELAPRFDYGDIVPHVRDCGNGIYTAIGSNVGLAIHASVPLEGLRHHGLAGRFRIAAGERRWLSIRFAPPEELDDAGACVNAGGQAMEAGMDAGFARTCAWWHEWSRRIRASGEVDEQTLRSAIVLKSLSFERTGAIVAAPTTSLPESAGGERNWDYRFSWIRDSVFTVRALYGLGCEREAERFLRFVLRSSAGSVEQIQIMYAIDGKRRLTEVELPWLDGYGGARPVRIGNQASEQCQLDVYGEILDLAWEWHGKGGGINAQDWEFLSDLVDAVCAKWAQPDQGIWEFRGAARHFVHSKAMCWGALDQGIRLARERHLPAPLDHWNIVRSDIRHAIERDGYDADRGIFVQAFGNNEVDAASLLLPRTGFVAYGDPRMVRTADAVRRELDEGGLLLRYRSPDGLPGHEGAFLPCTFWLVRCLAYQGRLPLAQEYYERALDCANELGLFPEEFDVRNKQMLGNFPQALTHVSQITAKRALDEALRLSRR
jgi:GH15 family glucan-1,4-alpha-glucosidase